MSVHCGAGLLSASTTGCGWVGVVVTCCNRACSARGLALVAGAMCDKIKEQAHNRMNTSRTCAATGSSDHCAHQPVTPYMHGARAAKTWARPHNDVPTSPSSARGFALAQTIGHATAHQGETGGQTQKRKLEARLEHDRPIECVVRTQSVSDINAATRGDCARAA